MALAHQPADAVLQRTSIFGVHFLVYGKGQQGNNDCQYQQENGKQEKHQSATSLSIFMMSGARTGIA